MYIANSLENNLFTNHLSACFLNWNEAFLGYVRFNFVQMKFLVSQMAPPQERSLKGEFLKKSSEPVDQMQKYLAGGIPMIFRYDCAALVPMVTYDPALKSYRFT